MPRDYAPPNRTQRPFRRPAPDRRDHFHSRNRHHPRHNAYPYPTDRFDSNRPRHFDNHHGQQRRELYNRASFHPYNRDVSQSHRRQFHAPRRHFRAESPRPYKRIEYNHYTPRTTNFKAATSITSSSMNTVNADLPDLSPHATGTEVSAEQTITSQRSENVGCTSETLAFGNVHAEELLRKSSAEKNQDNGANPYQQSHEQCEESAVALLAIPIAPKENCQTPKLPTAGPTEVETGGIEENDSISYMEEDHCEVVDNAEGQLAGAWSCHTGRTGSVLSDVTKQRDPDLHTGSQNRIEVPKSVAENAHFKIGYRQTVIGSRVLNYIYKISVNGTDLTKPADLEVTVSGIFSLINDCLPPENKERTLRGLMGAFIVMKDWVPNNSKDEVLRILIGKFGDALKPEQEHSRQSSGHASRPHCPLSDNTRQSQLSQCSEKTTTESAAHVIRDASIQRLDQNNQQPAVKPRIRLILSTRNPADSENQMHVAVRRAPSCIRERSESSETFPVVAPAAKLSKRDRKRAGRGKSEAAPVTRKISKAKRAATPFPYKRPGTPYPHPQRDVSVPNLNTIRTRSISTTMTAAQRDIRMSPFEIRDGRNRLIAYQCSLCPQKKKKSGMAVHMEYHGADGRFTCHKCDFATDSKHVFNGHLKYHPKLLDEVLLAGRRKGTAGCETDESETDDENFPAKKSSSPTLPCVEPGCPYLGENCKSIAEHVQREHPICSDEVKQISAPPAMQQKDLFQCSDCPSAFIFEGSLMVHSRRVHSKRHRLDSL